MKREQFYLLAFGILSAPLLYEVWWHLSFGYTTCLAGVLK